jgi:hypothetical protein
MDVKYENLRMHLVYYFKLKTLRKSDLKKEKY